MTEYNSLRRSGKQPEPIGHNLRFPSFKRECTYPNYESEYVLGIDTSGNEYIVRLSLTSYVGSSMMEWNTYGNKKTFHFDDIVYWQPLPENPNTPNKMSDEAKEK